MVTEKTALNRNGHAGPKRAVVIDDRVLLGMGTLEADERATVESVIHSPDRLSALSRTAHRGGTNGELYIADASPHLKVVFRLTPTAVEVVDLLSKRAFDQLRELQAAAGE